MAKIYTKDNRMQRNWKRCKRLAAISLRLGYVMVGALAAAGAGAAYYREQLLAYALIPMLLLILILYLVHYIMTKQAAVLNAGVVGENTTRQLIRHLPGNYIAVSNVRIEFEGSTSELDMIVVGPTGVFVIETKNYSGSIVGKVEDTNWKRAKRIEYGQNYAASFYSPVKQVATHAYRLSKFLKKNKIFVWVQGLVYFSDSAASIKISGNTKKIPVFRAEAKTTWKQNKLLRYIRTFPVGKKLSPRTVDKIVRMLRA